MSAFEQIWFKRTKTSPIEEGLRLGDMFLTKDGDDVQEVYAWSTDKDGVHNETIKF